VEKKERWRRKRGGEEREVEKKERWRRKGGGEETVEGRKVDRKVRRKEGEKQERWRS
jgi:hypothetical protein